MLRRTALHCTVASAAKEHHSRAPASCPAGTPDGLRDRSRPLAPELMPSRQMETTRPPKSFITCIRPYITLHKIAWGKESAGVLFSFNHNPDFCEVLAELSRIFRTNLRYHPGFPASATYDEVSHSLEGGLSREENDFRGTIAKLSRSPLHPSWWSLHVTSLHGPFGQPPYTAHACMYHEMLLYTLHVFAQIRTVYIYTHTQIWL